MMYARMPELSREERLARTPILDLTTAQLSPAEAANRAGIRAQRVAVSMRGPRPIYRFTRGRDESIVFADTGETLKDSSLGEARDTARVFADATAPPRYLGLLQQPDQWTLRIAAVCRCSDSRWTMPRGPNLCDVATGDVVPHHARRTPWAHAGPVTHWVYYAAEERSAVELDRGRRSAGIVVATDSSGVDARCRGAAFAPLASAASPYQGIAGHHRWPSAWSRSPVYSGLLGMEPFGWFESAGSRASNARRSPAVHPICVRWISIRCAPRSPRSPSRSHHELT